MIPPMIPISPTQESTAQPSTKSPKIGELPSPPPDLSIKPYFPEVSSEDIGKYLYIDLTIDVSYDGQEESCTPVTLIVAGIRVPIFPSADAIKTNNAVPSVIKKNKRNMYNKSDVLYTTKK